jgi:hypothetical protein
MIAALHYRPGWNRYDSSGARLTTMRHRSLILFLPRSGFGVYSIDSHVSIEKYNILWLKGIVKVKALPKSMPKVSFGNSLSQLIGQTGFLPIKS